MTHSFDVELAVKYGVNAAILLQNIYWWICKNEANERHYYDGCYWTYNSRSAFVRLFPYLSERQIKTAMDKLIDDGVIKTGDYNTDKWKRPTWYALTEKGWSYFKNVPNDGTKMSDRQNKTVSSNTDIYTDNNININISAKEQVKKQLDDRFTSFWKAYPRKVKKKDAYKLWCKLKPDDSLLQAILKDLERKKKGEWKDNEKYIPHPTTYLNQRRWEDEVDTGEEPPREIPWWELTPKEQEQRARELEERGISL